MAIHFREFAGTYMEHCHNTQHEDNSMLLRWDIEKPGQFKLMPTPLPTWEGVEYVDSAALPTFRSGEGYGLAKAATAPVIGSIKVNGGAITTTSAQVTLTLSAKSANGNVTQMQFSDDGGMNWTPYENYATTRSATLTPGAGSKSITVRFKDALGVPSNAVTALITLGAAAPAASLPASGGGTTTKSAAATVTASAGSSSGKGK
jgi:manganese oxidase